MDNRQASPYRTLLLGTCKTQGSMVAIARDWLRGFDPQSDTGIRCRDALLPTKCKDSQSPGALESRRLSAQWLLAGLSALRAGRGSRATPQMHRIQTTPRLSA